MAPLVWLYLPDSPEQASFLTKREKEYIINRLALETGSGRGRVTNNDKINMRHIMDGLKEWKIWCAWVMFWANTIGTYGLVNARIYCNVKLADHHLASRLRSPVFVI